MKAPMIHIENLHIQLPRRSSVLDFLRAMDDHKPAAIQVPEGAVLDAATGLMWTTDTIATGKTWEEAKKVASEVTLGGFSEWRLPTLKELQSIVDYARHSPAIDTDKFKCDSAYYWSSTICAESPSDCAWDVLFSYGGCGIGIQSYRARVRAVRSVAASASQ